jgi:hypothetical protein
MIRAKIAALPDRGVIRVHGADATKLLQDIITTDMSLLDGQPAVHAALLTPQGKILFEFFVVPTDGGYLLETGADQVAGLIKRLAMYKLRAKVEISDVGGDYRVLALWGESPPSFVGMSRTLSFPDPRLPALGTRILTEALLAPDGAFAADGADASAADYHAHRIALGVPEAGKDYALGDTFPHEADMDQLGGVSFTKGCFVGQEVVSRMQHRAHVRKRVVPVEAVAGHDIPSGADVVTGTAVIGKIGSVAGRKGLALVRLDRAAESKAKGQPLKAGDIEIVLRKPDWAAFDLEPAAQPAETQ